MAEYMHSAHGRYAPLGMRRAYILAIALEGVV